MNDDNREAKRLKEGCNKSNVVKLLKINEATIVCPATEKRSEVWKRFGHPKINSSGVLLKGYAVCVTCSMVYTYDSKCGNTPLNMHKCKDDRSKTIFISILQLQSQVEKALNSSDRQQLNEKAVTVCAVDRRPIKLFEG